MRNLTAKIIGTLAAVLELRYTPNGTAVADFTVAGEVHKVRADTGETVTLPFYLPVSMLGKAAENLAERNYQPGDALMITGEPQFEEWLNEARVRRNTVTVRALNVEKLAGEFETFTDKGMFIRMVGGLNSFGFIGHLAADAEISYTPSGDAVCNYRVGVSDSYVSKGVKVEKTHWFDCIAWRDEALAMEGAKKGQPVSVLEAALFRDVYVDKAGDEVKRRKFEVTAHALLENRPVRPGATPRADKVQAAPAETEYLPADPAAAPVTESTAGSLPAEEPAW